MSVVIGLKRGIVELAEHKKYLKAVDTMCRMFPPLALFVAQHFGFSYHQVEEDGMREYIRITKGDYNGCN